MENDIVKMLFFQRQRQKKRSKIRTISGVPPLTYKAIEGTLTDYRIYGQTVDGESVGDRTGNLFNGEILQGFYSFSNGIYYGSFGSYQHYVCTNKIECKSNTTYTIQVYAPEIISYSYGFIWWDENLNFISAYISTESQSSDITTVSATAPNNAKYMAFDLGANSAESTIVPSNVSWIMLNEGSTPLPYEPYGYKVPVTVSNGTDTQTIPIYISEQIKKVGDEAEYIDYGEQKLHRVGAEDIDVNLPELPTVTGTNVLSVETAVQPSGVEITGRIKKGE